MMYEETFLEPPHGTTPAAVIANKIKLRSFKSSEHIYEKIDGSYREAVIKCELIVKRKNSAFAH